MIQIYLGSEAQAMEFYVMVTVLCLYGMEIDTFQHNSEKEAM